METNILYALVVELDEECKSLTHDPPVKDLLYVKWLATEIRKEFESTFRVSQENERKEQA